MGNHDNITEEREEELKAKAVTISLAMAAVLGDEDYTVAEFVLVVASAVADIVSIAAENADMDKKKLGCIVAEAIKAALKKS